MKGYNVGIEEDPVLQHGDNDVIVRARESSTTLNMRREKLGQNFDCFAQEESSFVNGKLEL